MAKSNIFQKVKFLITIMAIMSTADIANASHRYEIYEVFVLPMDGTWDLNVGDNAAFEIRVLQNNVPVKSGEVSYEVSEDMMPARLRGKAKVKNGVAIIDGGTMKVPGFLRCNVVYRAENGWEYSSKGTIAFSKDKIEPTTQCPQDFGKFWETMMSQARDCGLTPRMTLMPEMCTDNVNVYHVSYAVGHVNRRFYGMLAVPKKNGKYPAVVVYPGAGVHKIGPAMEFAERGVISLSIGIHGIPLDMDVDVYENLDWGALQGYQYANMNNRDNFYYRRVVQGAVRAVDFVLSLPECNGCLATYGGSQGGYLSIAVASLHPAVKFLTAHFPAMSDLEGYLHGRAGGWPHMLKDEWNRKPEIVSTLRYFDTVNFAKGVKCPGFYTYGYNDMVCPPTSTTAVFNTIKAPKERMIVPTTEHYTFTEQYQTSVDKTVQFLQDCSDRGDKSAVVPSR